ncbi:MAG TPA: hypothetical protein VMT62_03450 [Syntrophorhabdaceae bacterium]|nr:hypothetical protein [Syntrophorhabdaceae bacterium]
MLLLCCSSLILFFVFLPCTLLAFWPLSWELGNEKRYLGPLVSYDEEGGGKHLVVRPFLSSYDSEEGGTLHYLFPLGKSTPEKSYFVPIYLSKKSETESDAAFLLFFGGGSEKKGSYGGFFPFYGYLYNRFSQDEIDFFAWPLYSHIEADGATKTNVLWPFFASYGGTDRGFKAWPLYGDHLRPGVRRTRFYLWPIFFKDEKNLDTDEPIDSFFAIPFYLRSTSRLREYKAVLWPFFTYSRDPDKEKWNILWPIFSKTAGEEDNGYSYFPIISKETKGKDRTFSFLWPIYREYEFYVKDERFFQRSIVVINRYMEDDRGVFFNVWPFFEYQAKNQDATFLFPSILPFRDRGFDRIIKPLITLYERKKTSDRTTTNLCYGLYTYERTDETWKTRFAFILSLKKDKEGPGFEFLSGLFGVDSKSVKIFFIPIKRSDSATDTSDQSARAN